MEYIRPINGVYWGYNPFTNHLLTFWDIQVFICYLYTIPKKETESKNWKLDILIIYFRMVIVVPSREGSHIPLRKAGGYLEIACPLFWGVEDWNQPSKNVGPFSIENQELLKGSR